MKNENDDLVKLLSQLSKEEYCYLTTKGRKSRHSHEIEIWFGIHENSLYLLSGGGGESDWVKNLRVNPDVTVRIAKHTFFGSARIVRNIEEESSSPDGGTTYSPVFSCTVDGQQYEYASVNSSSPPSNQVGDV